MTELTSLSTSDMHQESILIVVAHPDDEALGCGGAAAQWATAGHRVRSVILVGDADARRHRPEVSQLHEHARAASQLLGFDEPILGQFPNIALNTVPHLELVQFVEAAIAKTQATVILTHHPSDLNDDHLHTSRASQAAARLFQRRADIPALRALLFMEILSSTDWAFPSATAPFRPDTFVPLGEQWLSRKLDALAQYEGVMRDFPHPRSAEVVRGLAALRGGQAGMPYAEAFQTAFRALMPNTSF
jgi:LmbE family N-acetylglucosaminyl deacetylase